MAAEGDAEREGRSEPLAWAVRDTDAVELTLSVGAGEKEEDTEGEVEGEP